MVKGAAGGRASILRLVDVQEQYGRHILADMLAGLPPLHACCDLGVGRGQDLQLVRARFPLAHLAGIDCTERHRALLAQAEIQLHVLNLEQDVLPFPDESVDFFIANQVYEHLKEIFWVSHQVSQKLKTSGYLFIGVPNIHALHNRLLFNFGMQPSQMKSYSAHVRGFGAREIPQFLDACFPGGYRLVRVGGAQFYPFPKRLARILCKCFPSLAHSMFFLFQKIRPYAGEFVQHPIKAHLESNFYLGAAPTGDPVD